MSMGKSILRLAGILFIITAVVAGALGYVNNITKDKIEAIQAEKVQNAMKEIVPDAEGFVEVTDFVSADKNVVKVYEIRTGGAFGGLCVQVAPNGFGGAINMIVGVDAEGMVLGVRITSMTETAGLGSKTNDAEWLAQYTGLSGTINLVKNSKTAETDVVAISGATISSRAVTSGVQSALDFAATYQGGAQ